MILKHNMGTVERWIRVIGGLAVAGIAIVFSTELPVWAIIVLILLGASQVIEAALSWCPLKAALGLGKRYQKE